MRLGVLCGVVTLAAVIGGSPATHAGGSKAMVAVAAGDIACDPGDANFAGGRGATSVCKQAQTATLLRGADLVLALGDLQYEDGSRSKFIESYERSWGAYRSITRPAPGNHDYGTSGAAGYFSYFGRAAGDPAKGYYSFERGAWHLIALNSECAEVGGCAAGSPQERWLRRNLAASKRPCVLAYWHRPRFSSGLHGSDAAYDAFWRALYGAHADVVLVGHDHDYERFALQDPDARRDPAGIREFVVGTGGRSHYPLALPRANSQVRNGETFGVLRLTLGPARYDWRFVPVKGASFSDAGSGRCHPKSR